MPLKGIKIEFELHRKLRKAAADQDTTIQQLLERAVESMLAGPSTPETEQLAPKAQKRITGQFRTA